ncbi:MAG: DNA polymerase III subunit delta [Tannerella sp.]|jgi:DNA polymerase-3 subunit delta'|nr:DNA polymerase III subunit delta [Tannerella sp.]
MFFKDVIGQDELKRYLTVTARKGVVPHALLFCGEEGTGAFQLAFAFARYINCTERSETDSCGRCPSCLKYNELAHPDLHFVFPIITDEKKKICDDFIADWRNFLSSNIKNHDYFNLDKWLAELGAENKQAVIYAAESDSIIHKMNLKVYEAEYRVLFVWMPERMNVQCANKLLKIIEEPPAKTAIIMISDKPDMVLGTIFSRSQPIHVPPVRHDILEKYLAEKYGLTEDNARQITHLSNGNYLKASELITEDNDNAYFLEAFKTMMRNGWKRDITAMKSHADEIAGIGRERQKNFLAFCQRMIRENFLRCLDEPGLNYMNEAEASFSEKFSPFVNERNIVGLMEEFALAEQHIAQNVNAKMVFFDLSLRITVLIKA